MFDSLIASGLVIVRCSFFVWYASGSIRVEEVGTAHLDQRIHRDEWHKEVHRSRSYQYELNLFQLMETKCEKFENESITSLRSMTKNINGSLSIHESHLCVISMMIVLSRFLHSCFEVCSSVDQTL